MNSSRQLVIRALAFSVLFTVAWNTQAQIWIQTGALSNRWAGIACSADGAKLAAVSGGQFYAGQIYTSTNGGTNWSLTTAPTQHWTSIASSSDGTRLAAAAYASGIYTSTNAGATWVPTSVAAGNWTSIASSADGAQLAAARYVDLVYRSADYGLTWTSNTLPFVADIQTTAVSADGATFVAANNTGRILVSTNGTTWGRSNWLGSEIFSINVSPDGQRLSAIAFGRGLFTSGDGGASWHSNGLPANSSWLVAASSVDGTRMTAVGQKSIIYSTTDSGAVWISNSAPNLIWSAIASSADGGVVFAAPSNGGIWTRLSPPASVMRASHSNSNLMLSWVIPSTAFVVQHTPDLAISNWVDVVDEPAPNISRLEYELQVPVNGQRAFYRLKFR